METLPTLIYLIFFIIPVQSINLCEPVSCQSPFGPNPIIMFPFRLVNRQPERCGYPGFDLYCNSQNETVLNLTQSGEFIVDFIDYRRQALFVNDPDSCLPNRLLNFTPSGSRFQFDNLRDYTFLNCSDRIDYSSYHYLPLYCFGERNYTLMAMDSHSVVAQVAPTCRIIANVSVPVRWASSMYYWSPMERGDLQLFWTEPACWGCGNRGGICGFNGNSGFEIGCSVPARRVLSRGTKYGIIIGIGIPGLMCITGLVCYFCSMLRSFHLNRNLNLQLPTTGVSEQRLAIRSTVNGLDRPTIESYPSMVLGESRRLPKPSDVTCPICLTDYEAKETLRSIPECNHYFHADCIDEWLKLNGTCPLCRNSPESSMGTHCSSMSLSSPSSSISGDH